MFRKIFYLLIIVFVSFLTMTSCAKKMDDVNLPSSEITLDDKENDNLPDIKFESIKEEIKDIEKKDQELNDKLNNAMTQLDMNMISQEIYELWDNELNSLWNRIKEKDKLLEEQREWIKEKEKKVKEAGAEYEGGSMKPLVESMEAAKITKERVYILVKYFENLQ